MKRWPIALVSLLVGGLLGAVVTTTRLQGQAPPPPIYPKELTSYRDIVKRVLPAVVSIESKPTAKPVAGKDKDKQNQPRRRLRIEGLPEEFRKQLEEQFGMQDLPDMEEMPQYSFGSGFVIDPKGVILTNYHVVAGTDRVEVRFAEGSKRFLSTEIKGDPKNDIAIVRIKSDSSLPYLQLGDSEAMEIGDRVLAVGAPYGLSGSVTSGIVSAKGRGHMTGGTSVVYEDYLQTDAAINPGNSGGPLVNLEGQVVGINTMIKTRTGGSSGVGLAISSNVAKNVADQLIKTGVVRRGYLGVSVRELQPEIAQELGVKDSQGVYVGQVVHGAPAAKAGVQEGDVITAVNGKPLKDGRDLQRIVAGLAIGKPAEMSIIRDGKAQMLSVVIQEQPDKLEPTTRLAGSRQKPSEEEDEVKVDKAGMSLTDLTPDLAKTFGFNEEMKGAMVAKVDRGSVAAEAGLRRGLVVSKINRKSVKNAKEAADMLNKADLEKGVVLQVELPPAYGGGGSTPILLKAETANK